MKRRHIELLMVTLIVVLLAAAYLQKRHDLQCFVFQQASKHQQVFDDGFATLDEIRQVVADYTLERFNGGEWRANLDDAVHAVLMGGSRSELVAEELRDPAEPPSDWRCFGDLQWDIYDSRGQPSFVDSAFGANLDALHEITAKLRDLPAEELAHYKVEAQDYALKSTWTADEEAWIHVSRIIGEVSAKDWLKGKILPEDWVSWYAAWREGNQETDANGEE